MFTKKKEEEEEFFKRENEIKEFRYQIMINITVPRQKHQ